MDIIWMVDWQKLILFFLASLRSFSVARISWGSSVNMTSLLVQSHSLSFCVCCRVLFLSGIQQRHNTIRYLTGPLWYFRAGIKEYQASHNKRSTAAAGGVRREVQLHISMRHNLLRKLVCNCTSPSYFTVVRSFYIFLNCFWSLVCAAARLPDETGYFIICSLS